MPIIKFHLPAHTAPEAALEALASRIHEACVDWLQARPDAVQLCLLGPVQMLRGEPAYIEVLYRHQPTRDRAVMQRFVQLLESLTEQAFGLRPRIRCIAIEERLLHALN